MLSPYEWQEGPLLLTCIVADKYFSFLCNQVNQETVFENIQNRYPKHQMHIVSVQPLSAEAHALLEDQYIRQGRNGSIIDGE